MVKSLSRRDFFVLFYLSLAYWVAVLLLPALPGIPLNDDWAFASTAYGLAHNGILRLSDAETPTLVVQALWGAVFCLIQGSGPSALRLSTLSLAWLGGIAFYVVAHRASGARGGGRAYGALPLQPALLRLIAEFHDRCPGSLDWFDRPGVCLARIGGVKAWAACDRLDFLRPLLYGVRQNALLWPVALTFYLWKEGAVGPPHGHGTMDAPSPRTDDL